MAIRKSNLFIHGMSDLLPDTKGVPRLANILRPPATHTLKINRVSTERF
jgi:hypothetical protein